MKKKLFSLALAAALSLTLLAGCSGNAAKPSASTQPSAGTQPSSAPSASEPAATVKLRVAASPTPHAEILEVVKTILAAHGEDITVTSADGLTTFTFTLSLARG